MITLDKVTINHNGKVLFDNLNLQLESTEHLGIIGSAESGKSQLLNVLAGQYSVAQGTFDCPYKRKDIAMLTPDYHFKNRSGIADMFYQQRYNSTMMDNIPLVSELLAEANKDSTEGYWNLQNTTELLGLAPLLNEEVIKLSNGETKRLRLASLLLKNPKLLLLHSPLTGLDKQTRLEFDTMLSQIAQSGIQLIMTVNKTEIPQILTKIIEVDSFKISNSYIKEEFEKIPDQISASIQLNEMLLENLIPSSSSPYKIIIDMKDVNIRYDDRQILQNISWQVKSGEKWALRGPNGSGKSTLLSLINGDNPQAYANDIVLFDRKKGTGETIWDIKEKIGFVSPELLHYFRSNHSCLHVVLSGLKERPYTHKTTEAEEQKALEWMTLLGIAEQSTSLFKQTSLSIQRLVLLARALLKNPSLLLLDEPCQGLDRAQTANIQNIIDTISQKSNVSIVYVTHYEEELPSCIDHVIELKNGLRIQ